MPAAMRGIEPDPTSMRAKNKDVRERQGRWVLSQSPQSICWTELQDGPEMLRKALYNSKKKC